MEGDAQIPEIEVSAPIVESVVLTRTYPATLSSDSHADVVARVSGTVTGKFFEDGARVVKGQRLFSIETTKYAAAVSEATASLRNAESQLSYASDRLDALCEALKSNAVSEMDVVQARNTKIQAQAAVNSAKAQLQVASTNLGYCTVVAPVSGKISASLFDVGAYVGGEGAPVALASIYNEGDLSVQFDVEESQFADLAKAGIQVGDSLMNHVPLEIEGSGPASFFASIYYVSPDVNPSTGTVTMKGHVKDPSGLLRQGMYVKAALPYGTDPKGVLVRDASIGTDQLGKYIYVVNDSDKVVYRHIEVGGLYRDSLRLVTKGISPSDKYVTKAMLNVRQGMKVKPVSAARNRK